MAKVKRVQQARRRARELAVQFLYSMEARSGQDFDERLNAFMNDGFASDIEMDDDVKNYMFFLADGVWRARSAIDDIMRRIVTGWRLERMVAVDRAVIRVAVFEGFLKKEVPVAVAISEAVDIASVFGTEESGGFVNGVLAKVLRFIKVKEKDENDAASASKESLDG